MKILVIPSDPAFPMDAISVGVGCSFDCTILGVNPRADSVQLAFGLTGDTAATRVSARRMPGGEWFASAPAACFPAACTAHYHVTSTVNSSSQYLGSGSLRVLAAIPPAPNS